MICLKHNWCVNILNTKVFQRFTALGIGIDAVANNQGLRIYDDILKFYANQLVQV